MKKIFSLIYGLIAYVISLAAILYAIGFVGNFFVPKSIDSGQGTDLWMSVCVNVSLLSLFAIQHSVMARPGFKAVWIKLIPFSIERSTYVLFSSLSLCVLFWLWQPMTTLVWNISDSIGRGALIGLFWLGWLIMLLSTFMISHWDLFGLRQVFLNLQSKVCQDVEFTTRGFYKIVRHPIMLGFLITFWSTPTMTLGHLLFAVFMTAYIQIGLYLEERDLIASLGDAYRNYRKRVPMLIPKVRKTTD